MTSGIVDPPKPRLMTGSSGNESAVCQRRMVELPTKRMQSFGTAFWWSHFSKAAISVSNRSGPAGFFVVAADGAGGGLLGAFPCATNFVCPEKGQRNTKKTKERRHNWWEGVFFGKGIKQRA